MLAVSGRSAADWTKRLSFSRNLPVAWPYIFNEQNLHDDLIIKSSSDLAKRFSRKLLGPSRPAYIHVNATTRILHALSRMVLYDRG